MTGTAQRSMIRLAVCAALVLTMAIGGQGIALANDDGGTLNRIVKSGELRVGMSGSQPPFCVKAKSGELIGYEVELARSLANAMGVKLKIVERPFGELLDLLEKKWFEDGSWLIQVP